MNILNFRKPTFFVETILILLPISLLFSNFLSEVLILILVGIFFVNVKKEELIEIINNIIWNVHLRFMYNYY